MQTYFALITYPLTRQHFGSSSVLFDFFYVDVIRTSKEIKLHSNVIEVVAMFKLLVTDFLLVGILLLYLSKF